MFWKKNDLKKSLLYSFDNPEKIVNTQEVNPNLECKIVHVKELFPRIENTKIKEFLEKCNYDMEVTVNKLLQSEQEELDYQHAKYLSSDKKN